MFVSKLLPRAAGLVLVGVLAAAACTPRPADEAAEVAEGPSMAAGLAVEIVSPAGGDSVSLPATVRLAASGITIAPATGVREEGIGHHHLLIDLDATPDGEPIPAAPGYVHLGSGVSEYVLDSLPAGEHRIIAILAWGDHVPIEGARRDTVRFVVR
ncbi:MAG TPA: DUF4399 domain-containing protein [Gemmatimonadales bacterium]|nr:DUF4399 domain-containing protein [Gemmatimonadales bacterium]